MKLNAVVVVGVDLVEVFYRVVQQGGVIGGAYNAVAGNVFDRIAFDRNPVAGNHDAVINICERVVSDFESLGNDRDAVAGQAVPFFGGP